MTKSLFLFSVLFLSTQAQALSAEIRLHSSAKTSWVSRLNSLTDAENYVDIETFYLKPDQIGNTILVQLLNLKQSRPQIQIRLLLDGWGSAGVSSELACRLNNQGVQTKFFNRKNSLFSRNQQRRTHRKIWLTDKVAVIGGRNLSEEHFSLTEGNVFSDWDVEMTGAQIIQTLRASFEDAWNQEESKFPTCPSLPSAKLELSSLPPIDRTLKLPAWTTADIEWTADVPGENDHSRPVSKKVIELIQQSHHEVLVENAYFFPSGIFEQELKKASQRDIHFEYY